MFSNCVSIERIVSTKKNEVSHIELQPPTDYEWNIEYKKYRKYPELPRRERPQTYIVHTVGRRLQSRVQPERRRFN